MTKFKLHETERTPKICGCAEDGKIRITGICRPEDSAEFFNPFINWMRLFQLTESDEIIVEIELDSINTSSSLILYRLIRDLKTVRQEKVRVQWKYSSDDQDMFEIGKDFKYAMGDIIELIPTLSQAS